VHSLADRRAARPGPAPFDLCGPLPTGTTVLEASAGTGKTFTIAALAARYVAEGRAELPELMLVTFGREATQELRERVRERLVDTARGLADPQRARTAADPVLALLADAPDAEVGARQARLVRALAQFDAATIATTHQFCQQMLAGLGVAGDADPDAVFVETIDDLITEVVDDFYVRKYGSRTSGPPEFGRAEALVLARRAVHDGQARLEPADAEPGGPADVRYRFATAVRGEVARRKAALRIYTYDDMLTRLADALADPARGAAGRLRDRYRVVLVDEFQDTDPVQWEILRRAFHGTPHWSSSATRSRPSTPSAAPTWSATLDATEAATRHATLGTNWRSDAPLLAALDTVFSGAALGDRRITVHPVDSAHPVARLHGAPVDVPFRIRVLGGPGCPRPRGASWAVVGPARERVAADAAADIAALLAGGATLAGPAARRGPWSRATLPCSCAHNDQGARIRDALAAAAVPAVLTGTASVFGAPVAGEWLTLLEALEQPRAFRTRAAALTCFLGHTVDELCGPRADELLDRLAATVRAWATVLRERGVAALLEDVTTSTDLPGRLLALPDGERTLTDLRHIGQSLHAAAVAGHLGPAALIDWLRHRIDGAGVDVGADRSRRLDSDAAAVQIITIHRSKGLEFPIVYLPFAWDRNVRDPDVPLLHDGSGARVSTWAARPARAGRTAAPDTAPRRPARTFGCSTSRSPGREPGRHLVGAGHHHGGLAAAPAAARPAGAGQRATRVLPGPRRRAASTRCACWHGRAHLGRAGRDRATRCATAPVDAPCHAGGGPVRPRAGHGVAAHVLHRAHRHRRARAAHAPAPAGSEPEERVTDDEGAPADPDTDPGTQGGDTVDAADALASPMGRAPPRGPRSARWCTPCSRPPTLPRPTCRRS
jgi:exodeoxyribonuclease V beta subunit